jgi:hypothetical protein
MRTLGEWADNINAFWFGANRCEYIAWKGSHQVFVYDAECYPEPPSYIIQHNRRIETINEFSNAINNGVYMIASYSKKED